MAPTTTAKPSTATTTQHNHRSPTASTTTAHRKIELQSPTELAYLQQLGQHAATAKLTTAFPPSLTDPDDALRARVAELLDGFVTRTYAGVRANVSANGFDLASDSGNGSGGDDAWAADLQPFDARLAERVRDLEARKEALTERVADLRRTGGALAATRWRTAWEEEMAAAEKEGDVKMEENESVTLDVGPLERWDAVQEAHVSALDGLVGLKVGMSGTVGKLAEAKRVGEELDGS
jgi:kinetochor protein Mis14/NSL1